MTWVTTNQTLQFPRRSMMYWTIYPGSIAKAGMDGSDSNVIVSGLQYPAGIAVDFDASRLYWANQVADRMESRNLAGGDIRTIVQLSASTEPWGLALHGSKLYWGNDVAKTLQSSSKSEENVRTLYTSRNSLCHLTVVTGNVTRTRGNDCEGQACSSICVLAGMSFRCLG